MLALCAALCGCASTAPPTPDSVPWRDAAFGYDPALVTVSRESLFALDDAGRELRADPAVARSGPAARTAELLTRIFGPELRPFAYAGGHSTVAAETWHRHRGDCLSLSIMTVALARALDVPAQMQEVRVPVLLDRRGDIDFLNRHVNVRLRTERELRVVGLTLPAGPIVVDFEPQVGTRAPGRALADHEVLARFLNNLAGEQLAQGDARRAYAHLRAAAAADPAYVGSYHNLAQLYLRAGLDADAEALLRLAISQDPTDDDVALGALHKLLLAQGRIDEARPLERRLREQREHDPYYWLGLGLERLRQSQWAAAVEALEHAQALTSGFDEVHRYLAIAYSRSGRLPQARAQAALLTEPARADAKLAALLREFDRAAVGDRP